VVDDQFYQFVIRLLRSSGEHHSTSGNTEALAASVCEVSVHKNHEYLARYMTGRISVGLAYEAHITRVFPRVFPESRSLRVVPGVLSTERGLPLIRSVRQVIHSPFDITSDTFFWHAIGHVVLVGNRKFRGRRLFR
jgi:hypothetical protein